MAKIETAYIKCTGKGSAPIPGTDRDGLKGKCPECPGMITLTGKGLISSHLVGGINAPVSKGLAERGDAVRIAGEGSRVIGNAIESAGMVKGFPGGAPLVRGRDMEAIGGPVWIGPPGLIPPAPQVRRTREEAKAEGKRRPYAEAAGTMAGGIGRTRLDGGIFPKIAGGRHGWLTTTEVGELSTAARRRYWAKVKKIREAEAEARERRRFVESLGAVQGDGPNAVRPYGSVPVGVRTAQHWDGAKGGRTVETIVRRSGERSPLRGVRIDAKPSGTKNASERIFGRTLRPVAD